MRAFKLVGMICYAPFALLNPVTVGIHGVSGSLPLTLELESLRERYCGEYAESGTLQITARLRFMNRGKEPLILYKASGSILRLSAHKNRVHGSDDHPEFSASLLIVDEGRAKLSDLTRPSERDFAILPPGASLVREELIPLPYKLSDLDMDALSSGLYFIRVEVETWPESLDLGIVLRDRWKRWGNLWYQPSIRSEPLEITIAPNPETEDCD